MKVYQHVSAMHSVSCVKVDDRHISNIAGLCDMSFAYLFQDMRGRTKRAGEYQDSEKKNLKNERLGDKVQEGKPYFEERINMSTRIGSLRVMTLVIQSESNAGCFASNLAYFNCFIRSLRKICMLSRLCLFRGMHFIFSLAD